MFDPQSDPLALGAAGRARLNRFALAAKGQAPAFAMNPQWDTYFETVGEAMPKGKAVRYGEDNPTVDDTYADPATYDQQQKAVNQLGASDMPMLGPSEQLGTFGSSPALAALRKLIQGHR